MSELYELPDGWEWKEINNVIGKTKNKAPQNELEKKFTYIDISSINRDTFTIDTPKTLKGSEAPSRAKKEVIKNDIVFATTRPNLKNIAVIKEEYDNPIASTGFCVLRANKTIHYQYLFFYVLSNVFYKQVEKSIRGAQYPAVSDTDVKKISIPLPPLPEQQRIVTKLDLLFEKIDKSIALHQKNMNEADVFMGSILNDVFGELEERYEVVAVGTVADCIVPQRNKPKQFIGDIKWITTDDLILFNRVSQSSKGLGLRREEIEESQSKIIPKESVLMSCVGYLGMVSIADVEMVVNQQLHTFQCSELINNKFLMYALYVKQNYMYSVANITTVAYMNKSKCNSIPVPIAPLHIQQKTVKYLDQILEKTEKVKSVQKEKMESLKALKASILDRAFRGEL